ncbi:xylose isomerase (plasmid) [Mycobacterium sp. djl-10]|nr:xylose isomerase [Mycobacterium sp. djl-10]
MRTSECSLNSITTRDADVWEVIRLAAGHGFSGVSLWRNLFDDIDPALVVPALSDAGLSVTSLCRAGMFPQSDQKARQARSADNRRAVDLAHALQAECLVVVCGPTGDDPAGARRQIFDGLAELLPYARQAGLKLAIEPFHPMMAASRSAITSLAEANDLIDALQDPIVGIALDAYHVWWDVTLDAQIHRTGARLFSVQIGDWVTPVTNELSSRGMPGDGCIDLRAFIGAARRAGFAGLIEIEVLSDHWWAQPVAAAAAAAAAGVAEL